MANNKVRTFVCKLSMYDLSFINRHNVLLIQQIQSLQQIYIKYVSNLERYCVLVLSLGALIANVHVNMVVDN